jgi:hypothetical protein
MHPEVTSDKPGKCPKCGGMNLIPKPETGSKPMPSMIDDKGLGLITWKSYTPLLVIFLVLIVSSLMASLGNSGLASFSLFNMIIYFMTGFFLTFASFKLLDLKGFAHGYSTYDILASRVPGYGYMYPFIELGFGLMMLAGIHTPALLWTEVGVMVFSGIGVSIKIAKGEKFQCACLGTFLKVPLTYITLIEDFGMAILALILIVVKFY